MFLSLAHPPPTPSKTSDSPARRFLRPSTPTPAFLLPAASPCKSHLRASPAAPGSTAHETLAKSALRRISEKLRSLGYLEHDPSDSAAGSAPAGPGSAGEIFIPTPQEIPKYRVGCTLDSSWSTPENPVPEPGSGPTITRFRELWRREREFRSEDKKAKVPSVAELTIPTEELKRLRGLGIRLQKRLKVGKAGITEGIVNGIHERWQRVELVKIQCEDLCRMNMKRTHEMLERKTGGLVVWRSGTIIILYRGANYRYPYFYDGEQKNENLDSVAPKPIMQNEASKKDLNFSTESHNASVCSPFVSGVGSPKKLRFQLPGEAKLADEADRLLDGLGPRFSDWWGSDPLPVDGDLLPAVIPGFRKPFRLLPFGIQPKLTDREMTILRRLGRPLPCHFALGRNRKHQGLAASIIKLWEKCEIAKIAIKRGVQNTNSEIMAEELKLLTGGVLLSRDKEYIVLYRGKDFLPRAVSVAIEERRNYGSFTIDKSKNLAKEEEPVSVQDASEQQFNGDGLVLGERTEKEATVPIQSFKLVNTTLHKVETKLSLAITKKERAEKLLTELEKSVEPQTPESDRETISEEERYMLRKVGLRMKPFLLLGRRGVFDGTIENMHLHWKYRELVKIISKDRTTEEVENAARILEAESGGILVALERVSKGHAIILYRGKNYQRPSNLRPMSLLNKREAMKRSLEAQRRESLKLHVLNLSKNIENLRQKMSIESSSNETENQNWSMKGDNSCSADLEKNVEEVLEVASEYLGLKDDGSASDDTGETLYTEATATKCAFSLKNSENKFVSISHDDDSSEVDFTEHASSTSTGISRITCPQGEAASTSNCSLNNLKDDSQCGLNSRDPQSPAYVGILQEDSDTEVPFRAAPLSNRERLLLRKQALKMRNRPVLAVGRNNVISGVAKTIKTHFKKHPLAIVNIKGRAAGTSVQQLIFELEEATGAVLVSREPNKVILYRGWGEGEAPGRRKEEEALKSGSTAAISPQLLESVRLECGFQFERGY